MRSRTHYLRQLAAGTLRLDATTKSLGHQFSAADTDETILSSSDKTLYVVEVMVSVAPGLTSTTIIVKDGTTKLLEHTVSAGSSFEVISNSKGLPFDSDLVMQASDTDPIVNAWGMLL